MSTYVINSHSPEETMRLAEKLGKKLAPSDVICLEGDLGAGKTHFTKGIGKALGVRRTINSPTFTIIKEYHGKLPLYHIDVYRLQEEEENLGFDEYFYGDGVTVVEWASLIAPELPPERLDVVIRREGENVRTIELSPKGERMKKICEELMNE